MRMARPGVGSIMSSAEEENKVRDGELLSVGPVALVSLGEGLFEFNYQSVNLGVVRLFDKLAGHYLPGSYRGGVIVGHSAPMNTPFCDGEVITLPLEKDKVSWELDSEQAANPRPISRQRAVA
jgi:hypothetical protein